jgi:hypothetical protein
MTICVMRIKTVKATIVQSSKCRQDSGNLDVTGL